MLTVTLISAQGQMPDTLPDTLGQAWGGTAVTWLSDAEAAEFSIDRVPDTQWSVWDDLQKMGVDLVVQKTDGRRKSMLLADMDSTMIEQECIDELAAQAGVGERVSAITAAAMNGELDFDGALRERVALLKGMDAGVIEQVLAERISFMPGGAVLLATMKENGAYAALVSGGFTAFTSQVARVLGFDEHRANTMEIEDGVITGEVGLPILGRQAKVDALDEITNRLGLQDSDVLAVGDGANDLGMLRRAGTGVALHAKPSVAAQCDVRVNFGDLTALLFLQGYKREDFVAPRV